MASKSGPEPRATFPMNAPIPENDSLSIPSSGDSESEEDEIYKQARSSEELRQHDRNILIQEEEREEMLRENGQVVRSARLAAPFKHLFGKAYAALPKNNQPVVEGEISKEKPSEVRRQRRSRRRIRRKQKKERLRAKAEHGEDGELMYEMEEGAMKEGSSTGDSSETEGSSERDRSGFRNLIDEKTRRRKQWQRFCLIHICIMMGFLTLVFGAWRLSLGRKISKPGQKLLSNGTALFAPTTIVISLDGFRADFLNRGLTPRLNAFIEEGVSPVYMLPSFPSVTFPNHYTLVTGLYPESHGVVGNTFWDPVLEQEFYYTDPARSMQGKWWGGEPLWVTAELQGIRTAIHMWPGSEAHIMDVEPSFLDKFNPDEPLPSKVKRVLEFLDKPGLENEDVSIADMRPQLIAAYVPNIDTDGHEFGPNSTEIRTTIKDVDNMLNELFMGLEMRNLTDVVNVVVVSDHGMATTSNDRLIQLDDLIDLNLVEHIDGWPLYGLRPKDIADLKGLYDKLASEAAGSPGFDVYLRDVNMPERYHFSKNQRIAPLWIIPKAGWAIVTKEEFNLQEAAAKNLIYHPRGLHGYDHENPLMRAIFVARGPSFPHAPNSRLEVFQNIEVYNIICDSLCLTPNTNNGTLRLPLKPVGLHGPEYTTPPPLDPIDPTATTGSGTDTISISPIEASSAADPNEAPPGFVGVDPVDTVYGDDKDDSTEGTDKQGFWEYWKEKLEGLLDWIPGIGDSDGDSG